MALSSSSGNLMKQPTVHWGPDPTHTDHLFLFFQSKSGNAAAVFGREKEGDNPSTGSGADYVFWTNKDEQMCMHYLSTCESDSA